MGRSQEIAVYKVSRNALVLGQSGLMDWVAEAGHSGAKEAPGFRAGALQPRSPINQWLTQP